MNLAELRAIQQAATPGPWYFAPIMEMDENGCMSKATNLGWVSTDPHKGYLTVAEKCWDGDAIYIATFNPQFVLGLLDRLERYEGALKEISIGRGAFALDPYEHAKNCIAEMKAVANEALNPTEDNHIAATRAALEDEGD